MKEGKATKINGDDSYTGKEWFTKDYYCFDFGEAEFGSWYDRAPIYTKFYDTSAQNIPASDYVDTIYSGDHYFRLGESQKAADRIYYKGKTGYLNSVYTVSSAKLLDKNYSYNASGLSVEKYNNEWVAYKNGPVYDYAGIAPHGNSYWLISRGKVRFDLSVDIAVYYDNGDSFNRKKVYLQIDKGEMTAIKSDNGIILWRA